MIRRKSPSVAQKKHTSVKKSSAISATTKVTNTKTNNRNRNWCSARKVKAPTIEQVNNTFNIFSPIEMETSLPAKKKKKKKKLSKKAYKFMKRLEHVNQLAKPKIRFSNEKQHDPFQVKKSALNYKLTERLSFLARPKHPYVVSEISQIFTKSMQSSYEDIFNSDQTEIDKANPFLTDKIKPIVLKGSNQNDIFQDSFKIPMNNIFSRSK
ncbi:uncharacterized protein [Prorops nasuta]|uniref:uncharacterized protein n=1 Tax=Prorops nasuta TaxID=863751 RepID=UPI0034CDE2D7